MLDIAFPPGRNIREMHSKTPRSSGLGRDAAPCRLSKIPFDRARAVRVAKFDYFCETAVPAKAANSLPPSTNIRYCRRRARVYFFVFVGLASARAVMHFAGVLWSGQSYALGVVASKRFPNFGHVRNGGRKHFHRRAGLRALGALRRKSGRSVMHRPLPSRGNVPILVVFWARADQSNPSTKCSTVTPSASAW